MLLADGNTATEWILARFLDRLTGQEVDLIRSRYELDGALTMQELMTKYGALPSDISMKRQLAVLRLQRLIEWESDERKRTATE